MYAKASYCKLGHVDLDGIWHWREMLEYPESYNLTKDDLQPSLEVSRAQVRWDTPWCHNSGDEWLVANPVEMPSFRRIWNNLFAYNGFDAELQDIKGSILLLPAELIELIVSFLGESDLYALACTLPHASIPCTIYFKNTCTENTWIGYGRSLRAPCIPVHQIGRRPGIHVSQLA